MLLPGLLSHTTLGDVFGQLYRARASCVLELREKTFFGERTHNVHFFYGLIGSIQSEASTLSVSEILAAKNVVESAVALQVKDAAKGDVALELAQLRMLGCSEEQVRNAFRDQLLHKLERLFRVQQADIRVRPSEPVPFRLPLVRPMSAKEFLHGRPRARDSVMRLIGGGDIQSKMAELERIRALVLPKVEASESEAFAGGGAKAPLQQPTRRPSMPPRKGILFGLGLIDGANPEDVRSALHRLITESDHQGAATECAAAFAAHRLLSGIDLEEN